MRYILVAVPEGNQPGFPDPDENGVVIAALPEGTHSLDIQAYWSVTDNDGKFGGGAIGFKAAASDWEVARPPGRHSRAEAVPRKLTAQERIEARHWLQELSEHARSVRNAMDPVHGMLTITDNAWAAQWADLRANLEAFTGRVSRGERSATASPGAFQDRNG